MVFWTIVFFGISLYAMVRGSILFSMNQRVKLLSIDKMEGKIDSETLGKEFLKDGCLQWTIGLFLAIAEVIYLVNAISYDTYKFPTLGAILIIIFAIIMASTKKKVEKMNEQELIIERAKIKTTKRITVKSFMKNLIWAIYFGYMFYILIF